MGTVYPTFYHVARHHLGDATRSYDNYPPVPDMNFMTQDPTTIDPYGTLPQGSWGQWWSPGSAPLAEASDMAGSKVYTQEQQCTNNYALEPESSEQWASPATSLHSYPIPSPDTNPTSVEISPSDLESRRGSASTQPDKRKRKRNTNQSTATKATRRSSTKKTIKSENAPDKPKTRGSRAKPAPKPAPQPKPEEIPSPDPDDTTDGYSKKVQERNRIASNKFRVKKREDAKRLRADEEDLERVNRNLSSCVSDLTLQVYELKMRLLQHTDCDCSLIQDYIANEAHRYIQDLGGRPQTTPPLNPPHHHE